MDVPAGRTQVAEALDRNAAWHMQVDDKKVEIWIFLDRGQDGRKRVRCQEIGIGKCALKGQVKALAINPMVIG